MPCAIWRDGLVWLELSFCYFLLNERCGRICDSLGRSKVLYATCRETSYTRNSLIKPATPEQSSQAAVDCYRLKLGLLVNLLLMLVFDRWLDRSSYLLSKLIFSLPFN